METILFSILMAIPQVAIFLYISYYIPKNISVPVNEPLQVNKYSLLEFITCILSPIFGSLLNQYIEPSGDLNPGGSFQVFPPFLLALELAIYIPAIILYLISKNQLQKGKKDKYYFIYIFSCTCIAILSIIPSSLLILSGAILIGFIPIFGIPILAPIINSILFTSKVISIQKASSFKSLKSNFKAGLIVGISIPLLLILTISLAYSPIQKEWISMVKQIPILTNFINQ
jgi:hypothetical protein